MDWKAEATNVIRSFDEALGRPPFPRPAPPELVSKANAVQEVVAHIVDAGKLKTLEGVTEVTTTLPVLCASLKEGSPDRKPCLTLYRPLLLAVGLAAPLSTYPISHILSDAKAVLGEGLYDDASRCATKIKADNDGTSAQGEEGEAGEAVNEATLFTFMATTHSLVPEDMCRFLRLPTEAPGAGAGGKKKSKSIRACAFKGTETRNAATSSSPSSSAVPRAVLDAMIVAPLADDCRQVFESFFDNTQKFLDVVASDGDLASRILSVYGARIVPKLKASSLLPCLNAALLDYYVDIIAATLQRDRLVTLLCSTELQEVPLRLWDANRLHELACAAASRAVQPEDSLASLVVYTFLYTVYCELARRSVVAAPSISSTVNCDGVPLSVNDGTETEHLFALAIVRTVQAALLADKKADGKATSAQAYVQDKTGIVVLRAADVPRWLEPLDCFAKLFLSRPVAVSAATSALSSDTEVEAAKHVSMGDVEKTGELADTTLLNLLRTVTKRAPKGEQHPSTSAAPSKQKSGPTKTKGRGADSNRNNKSSNASPGRTDGKTEAEVSPVPLSEVLASCCRIFLCTSLLNGPAKLRDSPPPMTSSDDVHRLTGVVVDVVRSYAYLLQHQPQRLNAVLWQPCLSFFTYCLWLQMPRGPACSNNREASFHSGVIASLPSNTLTTVLRSATAATDFMLWLSPIVLPYDASAAAPEDARRDVAQLFVGDSELWLAVVQAAVNMQNTAPQPMSDLDQHLFPASSAYVLGATCSAMDETVLQTLADSIVTTTESRRSVTIASLQRMHESSNANTNANSSWSTKCDETQSCFLRRIAPAWVPESGLRRLLDDIAILQAGHRAIQEVAEAAAKEAARQSMQEALRRAHELAAAHRSFQAELQERQTVKAAAQQQVQEEAARRRTAEAARFREDAAARARKQQCALETLRQKAAQTTAQREAERRARFTAYQQRLQSEYRVATFLEHLNLSSARVMATRDALRKVMDTITPDDLLEFLVSGVAKVPSDMLVDEEVEEEDESMVVETELEVATAPSQASPLVPHYGAERRDFWAEIMDHAVPSETTVQPAAPTPATPPTVPSPSTAYRKHSFHKRVSPLLDLFFYEDGDEYGNVPDALPTIRLHVAASVWPPAKTQLLGFANLREAFDCMRQRGLVEMRGGVVQLSLLGFRYHFPFHEPDGMLEVYVRAARERVRALIAQRGNDDTDVHDVGEEEAMEGNGEELEEDEESEEDDNGDRLLPEVEFGI